MNWSIRQSRHCYHLQGWSEGYFDINDAGHMTLQLRRPSGDAEVDLYELAHEIRRSGLNWPVLVRCTGILEHRLDQLGAAFERARVRHCYAGAYTAVYPVKVNQQYTVVRHILDHGAGHVGLESGSKSELMAILGLARRDSLLVCNGYKDREYVRLALIARKLGLRIYLVVEKPSELELIIQQARELEVAPLLGVRVRLASIGAGNWQNTGGAKSKFGLQAAQVLDMVERLRAEGMVDRLRLLHFHLGSQLPRLEDIRTGMREATRFYAELHDLGVPLQVMDVGGGLGVDYEGTASHGFCSVDYDLDQYAETIVAAIGRCCSENGLAHPELVTESGRAMTAHHALLITNVIDTEQAATTGLPRLPEGPLPDAVERLVEIHAALQSRTRSTDYDELQEALAAVQDAFGRGLLDLGQRALAERYYHAALRLMWQHLQADDRAAPPLLDEIESRLADKLFCNLSIFQSLPDVWALDQIFPVVPLQRLDEEPRRRAVLEDLTCDSDGRIDFYVSGDGIRNSLPVHEIDGGEPYLLGIFMVGAYQEILGDRHNLFGDTDAVNLDVFADGSWRLSQEEHGERVDELLRYVHFDPDRLRAVYRQRVKAAGLPEAQARQFLMELEAGLTGYSYHED
ncbi:MAG TPA: biosynthetic arginine decarboxylase [Gammaproteobacteria bacterium]|nr:biosynthetic arginine decarboxylase [Gammaproteobacteria bacterium]